MKMSSLSKEELLMEQHGDNIYLGVLRLFAFFKKRIFFSTKYVHCTYTYAEVTLFERLFA